MFGFLALVLLILIITCAEISIVLCYFQLCAEDHAWWWRAFLNSGAAGLYLLAYSGIYYCTQLEISGFVPLLLYVGYMALASTILPHHRDRRLPGVLVVCLDHIRLRQGGLTTVTI